MGIQASFMMQASGVALPLEDVAVDATLRDLFADLGGTEIDRALERAYQSRTTAAMPEDILLITDGEVSPWQQVVQLDELRARTASGDLHAVADLLRNRVRGHPASHQNHPMRCD